MIKSVLFDCDGVVIDRQIYFSRQFAQEFHIPLQELDKFFASEFQACILGQKDLKTTLEPYLPKWGWTKSTEDFLRYWFESENETRKDIIQLIKQLQAKSISCYLATNQEKYRMKYLADKLGFIHLFDHMFVSCEIKAKKPAIKFFQYVWESLEYLDGLTSKDEVLLIDDQEKNTTAAQNFGFKTCFFKSSQQCLQEFTTNGIIL